MNSAFPKWLKRLDPLLEEIERTNPIYEAFRLRREAYRQGHPVLDAIGWHTFFNLDSLPLLLIVGGVVFSPLCFLAPVSFLLIRWYRSCASRRMLADPNLPTRVADVFSRGGIHGATAQELWLAGAGGRLIMEAIYAESRERSLLISMALPLLLTAPALIWGGFASHGALETALVVPAMLFLAFGCLHFAQRLISNEIVSEQLIWRFEDWLDGGNIREGLIKGSGKRSILFPVFMFGTIFLLLRYNPGEWLDQRFGPFDLLVGEIRASWILHTSWLVLVATVLHFTNNSWYAEGYLTRTRVMKMADPVFQEYMRERVLERGTPREFHVLVSEYASAQIEPQHPASQLAPHRPTNNNRRQG